MMWGGGIGGTGLTAQIPTIWGVSDQSFRTVYLDINHWYALSRAEMGNPDRPEHVAVLNKLLAEVDAGRLVIPVSSVTYTELIENPRDQLRVPAANVILKLSRLATIAPATKILEEELDRELNRRFGRPAFPVKVPKIGYGVGFAFGLGRLKADVVTGADHARIEAQIGRTLAEATELVEYCVLLTPRSLRDTIPGFEPVSTRQDAAAELSEIQVMVDNLRNDPELAARQMDGIAARQLSRDILLSLRRALVRAGYIRSFPFHNKEELTDFLAHLPTQRVETSLKHHYVKQRSTTLKINHLRDIEALSVAIPYTDVVVTDADIWDVATNRARLHTEFDTAIFKSLIDAATYLDL
ncbi:MAG: hypothetical protein QOJ80_6954 [Mycobacterium sp.]|jgi:hypothetical protein|nr:hypothetical protein [Mycobacterium sp.]